MGTMKILPLGVIFLCKVFLGGFAEDSSCTPGFESELLVFKVHRDHLYKGERLGKVIFNARNGGIRIHFQSTDKRFDVNTDGTVMLKRSVTLQEDHVEFSVVTWDTSDNKHTVSVRVEHVHHLEHRHMDVIMNNSSTQLASPSDDLVLTFPKSSMGLKRSKREWVIPPIFVTENSRGPFPMNLVRFKSTFDTKAQMAFKITGEGADLDPKGIFTIERLSGWLRVTQPLDREKKASHKFIAHASGVDAQISEKPIEIIVYVKDQNDNNPVFTQNPFNGHVPETAEKGYEFMVVTATDADDPETDNADLRYSIVSQDPPLPKPNMFAINVVRGGIHVLETGMDREQWPRYTLVIAAADLKGEGRSTTGKAVITVTDSNDDPPQSEQSSHTVFATGTIANSLATDGDETGSPAWIPSITSNTFCLQ